MKMPSATTFKFGPDFALVSTGSSFDKLLNQVQIENCSGCAKCRSYCPIASSSLQEWTKGRGKITLLRELISGRLPASILEEPEFKEVMDSCINCKRCLTECPSGVDVPWLAMSARADYVRRKGESFSNRILTDTSLLCKQGSMLAPVANFATSLSPIRWGLEKVLGMDAKRHLPPSSTKPCVNSSRVGPSRRVPGKLSFSSAALLTTTTRRARDWRLSRSWSITASK